MRYQYLIIRAGQKPEEGKLISIDDIKDEWMAKETAISKYVNDMTEEERKVAGKRRSDRDNEYPWHQVGANTKLLVIRFENDPWPPR
ncbi:MAG: hypothetical protein MUF38_00230 [Anaerolineae bacterium]|jgi:hypothetical protein|nr:hypothetical protein [Anaerolineae bacterium]